MRTGVYVCVGVDYREHGEVNTALLPLTPSPLLPETFPRSPSNLQTRPGPRQRGRAARTVGVKQGFRWGPLLFHRPWLNVGSAGPTLTYGLKASSPAWNTAVCQCSDNVPASPGFQSPFHLLNQPHTRPSTPPPSTTPAPSPPYPTHPHLQSTPSPPCGSG